MNYVYVLKSKKDGSIYVGQTNDLRRRFEEHNSGKSRSTKFKTPFELIYYEAYKVKTDAVTREKQLKRFSGAMTALKRRITI